MDVTAEHITISITVPVIALRLSLIVSKAPAQSVPDRGRAEYESNCGEEIQGSVLSDRFHNIRTLSVHICHIANIGLNGLQPMGNPSALCARWQLNGLSTGNTPA